MLTITQGDIFRSKARYLVCPVNCVPGVMGAGLAKAFVQRWPSIRQHHYTFCRTRGAGDVKILPTPVYNRDTKRNHDVVFFATKDHWKDQSKMEWIRLGLEHLGFSVEVVDPEASIAIPALGAGLGELPWPEVLAEITAFSELYPKLQIEAYEPR